MAGQDLYQVVSTGRMLHAKKPEVVTRDIAKLFSIPEAQARRLLLKGWVIKDSLISSQALEYRARLHKMGLRAEVCPAGKFDNQQLIAKIKVAQRRRASIEAKPSSKTALDAVSNGKALKEGGLESGQDRDSRTVTSVKVSARSNTERPGTRLASQEAKPKTVKPEAQGKEKSLFSNKKPTVAAAGVRVLLGLLPAIVTPAVFISVAILCLYCAGALLWQIPLAVWQGELTGASLLFSLGGATVFVFLLLLLALPYFCFPRDARTKPGEKPLKPSEYKDLWRLFEQLSNATQLPRVQSLVLSPDARVYCAPRFSDVMRQELPLNLGLASVASLSGRDTLALVVRNLGLFQGKLNGLLAWLVLDGVRRLELMQWALENERSMLCSHCEPGPLKPFHQMLVTCGYFLLPVIERLENLHRALTRRSARYLESRADLWAADLIGSEAFAEFAGNWHRLVHADLMVAEIAREASAVGQCFENIPAAVAWTLENLDEETGKTIELAMSQVSDPWDVFEAADLERIEIVQQRNLHGRLQRAFSLENLFVDFPTLARNISAEASAPDCQVVENRRLLCSSHEAEEALVVLDVYFNRLPPLTLLPLRRPASQELQAMDLQTSIDWLRSKLIELRELREQRERARLLMVSIQLGAALIRAKVRIEPQDYSLNSASLAAAQEAAAIKRSELEEIERQLQHIYSAFYQRLCLAVVAMPARERQQARSLLSQLAAYEALATHLERLTGYSTSLAIFASRLSPDLAERELVQKYLALSARELDATFATVESSELLKAQGLDSALCIKAKREPLQQLPQRHQEALAMVHTMESRCKYASSIIWERYQIQLAVLLQRCLEREGQLEVNPLRLLQAV
ncbi:hypothetical protein [Microbulbifer variabilis]|uniref:hypothetical protein n=1 Tax=Microbulbifer variabilis TaxID=266805 RepID=UPI001CFE69E9|nr:hypothetical protein [Microbulbifer variabilis]